MAIKDFSVLETRIHREMDRAGIKMDTQAIAYDFLNPLKDKSPTSYGHCLSVGIICAEIAEHMHIDRKILTLAGLVHDIGKLQTDPATLSKTDPETSDKAIRWTEKDDKEIHNHVIDGYKALRGKLDFTAEVILWHHRFQKNGYPKKPPRPLHDYSLGTKALIAFYGRLLALADCYDALHRVNKKFGEFRALSDEEIRQKMFDFNPDQKILIENLYQAGIFGKTNVSPLENKEYEGDLPRILVGAPVYSKKAYITPEWICHIKGLSYPNYDILVIDNSDDGNEGLSFSGLFKRNGIKTIHSSPHSNVAQRITEARQKIYDHAVKEGYNYLMSIEQDVLVPNGIIEALLSHNQSVVGAPYAVGSHTNGKRRHTDYIMSASKLDTVTGIIDGVEVNEWYLANELVGKGLLQVKSCSLGCTLISTEVLKMIDARSNPEINRADDSYFFQDCKKKGIKVYVDTGLLWKVSHVKTIDETPFGEEL
jgi:putative nucleotidyltransferase with HDIG domain